jgi:hypothetical protein
MLATCWCNQSHQEVRAFVLADYLLGDRKLSEELLQDDRKCCGCSRMSVITGIVTGTILALAYALLQ